MHPRDALYPRKLTNQNTYLMCKVWVLISFAIAESCAKVRYKVGGFVWVDDVAPPLHPRDLC